MKKILMIATGGTIASADSEQGLAPALTGEELAANISGIGRICDLAVLQLMNIDSTNMRPRDWLRICGAVGRHYESYDGFVILHGTDTMAYTAAALSYLIQDSRKPIVITGSQKPMGNPYTDAKINVYQSIMYAADGQSCNVSVVFNGKVIAGTRGRKQRTRSFDAFDSINFPLLAVIRDERIMRYFKEPVEETMIPRFYHELNDRVFVLKLSPEVKPDIFGLLKGHYDAIILETFGIGGIPEYEDASFEKAIFDWVNAGKVLAVTTQVPEEGCELGIYKVGKKYSEHLGILQAGDMTTESLVAKLMWILGQTADRDKIKELFYKNINHDREPGL